MQSSFCERYNFNIKSVDTIYFLASFAGPNAIMVNLRVSYGVQTKCINVFCDYILKEKFPYFLAYTFGLYFFLLDFYNRLFILKTRQQ